MRVILYILCLLVLWLFAAALYYRVKGEKRPEPEAPTPPAPDPEPESDMESRRLTRRYTADQAMRDATGAATWTTVTSTTTTTPTSNADLIELLTQASRPPRRSASTKLACGCEDPSKAPPKKTRFDMIDDD